MAYIVQLQLRDSRKEFDTEGARDRAYDVCLKQLTAWGVPEGNIILKKIDNHTCDMGYHHDTIVEQTGE